MVPSLRFCTEFLQPNSASLSRKALEKLLLGVFRCPGTFPTPSPHSCSPLHPPWGLWGCPGPSVDVILSNLSQQAVKALAGSLFVLSALITTPMNKPGSREGKWELVVFEDQLSAPSSASQQRS